VKHHIFNHLQFRKIFDTKPQVISKLLIFEQLLIDWNQKINLISSSTLPNIWWRHILDSAQILELFPEKSSVMLDVGSGAGFPGLVISILGFPEVHLVESNSKKVKFLSHIVEKLSLEVIVHHSRIENLNSFDVDIITARAVAPLDKLLQLTSLFVNEKNVQIYLKGESFNSELQKARKLWEIDVLTYKSITNTKARVLKINKCIPLENKNG
jgi:16S rRNA (guanine527-N7)-methyltransferase